MKTKEFIVKITIDDRGHCHYDIRDYNGDDQSEYLPPLQAELEILKQRAGLTSVYDQEEESHDNVCSGFTDQPQQISKW